MPEPCGCPPQHPHMAKEDGTPGACLIDQCPCTGPPPPPNPHVLPGAPLAADTGFDRAQSDLGPGLPAAPDADLADVLVNYNEVFQAVHGRYIRTLTEAFQEIAELRAGFNQAVARMNEAEAERDMLREIVAGGQ